MALVKCEICGKEFNKRPCKILRDKHHTCSKECLKEFRERKWIVHCVKCGKLFNCKTGDYKRRQHCQDCIASRAKKVNDFIIDEDNNIVKIFLNRGKICTIDLEDFDKVKDKCISCGTKCVIVSGNIRLSKLLIDCNDDMVIDYKDGDMLNCTKNNLAVVTKSDNKEADKIRADNKSGFKGVMKHDNRWLAYIQKNGIRYYLGLHKTIEEAVYARKCAEEELHKYGTLVKRIRTAKGT